MQRKPTEITRQYLEGISDRNTAISEAASLDGLYSLPQLISLLQDIRKITEDDIEVLLKKITRYPSLERLRSKKYQDDADIFTKYGEDIVPELKKMVKQKVVNLTEANIAKFAQDLISPILKKLPVEATKPENKAIYDALVAHLKTALELICSLVIYNDMDYKQNHITETIAKEGGKAIASIFSKKDAPSKRDEIEAPLFLMRELAKLVTIHPNTAALWHQAERWLMGLHYRSYNVYPPEQKDAQGNIKKNEAGEYEIIKGDMVDKYLGGHGLSKYALSFYHRQKSEHFFFLLTLLKEKPRMLDMAAEKEQKEVSADVGKKEVKQKEKISVFLGRYIDQSIDVQFSMLVDAADHCEISEDDERRLKRYLEAGKKKISNYKEAMLSTWYIPTFFLPRRHAACAKETLAKIKDSEDVRYQLIAFYDLWIETNGKGSYEINPALKEILSGAYSILVKAGELSSPTKSF